MTSVTRKLTCFFGLQNCVKLVLFEILSCVWHQNNQKFYHLSGNNSSVWYTRMHFHHDSICKTLFWTLNRSIFSQHSSSTFLGQFFKSPSSMTEFPPSKQGDNLLIDWIFAHWTRALLCSTDTKEYPHSFNDSFWECVNKIRLCSQGQLVFKVITLHAVWHFKCSTCWH